MFTSRAFLLARYRSCFLDRPVRRISYGPAFLRYANYKGGKKYDNDNDYALKERGTGDPLKAESARIFQEPWKQAEVEPRYAARKREWKERYG